MLSGCEWVVERFDSYGGVFLGGLDEFDFVVGF